MANWWRFTLEQGKFKHFIQIHPYRMDKMNSWIDKMIKKYPQLKVYISQELDFFNNYEVQWDDRFKLVKLIQNNYVDRNYDYNFEYVDSEIFYYKTFPIREVNIRKLKLEQINGKV